MDKNHPLAFILRKKTAKDVDMMFDLIVANAYFAGSFKNEVPVEESREAFQHIKKLLSEK